ncbi:MAG: thymidine phosphorylase [Puniceicoccales bacterium]|jgi:pyrimidine-nucleoside phosphorylase|nr:thymidine phosphorylase [Puniceicoccales bacterium]
MESESTKDQAENLEHSFHLLIEKKRDNEELSEGEIRYLAESILKQRISDTQLAALVMAIYFRGLSLQETSLFTEEMMLSGEIFALPKIARPKIDRYATGGVGDKTGLVLIVLAAACGIAVPAMLGEEEGFIISDLDKLSAIPGISVDLKPERFAKQVHDIGCAITRQFQQITPIHHLLFRIRQQTGTIPSLSLTTCSLLSKKFSEGAEGVVVDVKWGNGSYIRGFEEAKQLARLITRVAKGMNRRCVALVTDMNQPLGNTVGTGLEIQEIIRILHGEVDSESDELILRLGMEMVRLAGVAGSTLSAKQMIKRHLSDGTALAKFREMVVAQGGDGSYIDNPDKFPKASQVRRLSAMKRGYVHTIDAGLIARGVDLLSRRPDNSIDHSVGISEIKKVGAQIKQGESLMTVHYNDETHLEAALEYLRSAHRLAPKRPAENDLIAERVA